MKVDNCNPYITNSLISKCSDIYNYAPPTYDIGVRLFRLGLEGGLIWYLCNSTTLPQAFSLVGLIESIFHFFKISWFGGSLVFKEVIPLMREWSVRKLADDQSKKNVILFCRAASDLTGAATSLCSKKMKAFEEFSKTHSIVLKKVSSIADINEAIDEITKTGRKITTLWISAHGSRKAIALGDERVVGNEGEEGKTESSIGNIHFSKLTKDANVILSACSVGGELKGEPNFAEWTQLHAGSHRKVYAPKSLLPWYGTDCTNVGEGSKASWTFKSLLGYDITSEISYDNAVSKSAGNSLEQLV